MPQDEYPSSVLEVLDDSLRFKPVALRAVRTFASSKPWRGNLDERKDKFHHLNEELAAAYEMPKPDLVFGQLDGSNSGGSYYHPTRHQIVLNGRLSVVSSIRVAATTVIQRPNVPKAIPRTAVGSDS